LGSTIPDVRKVCAILGPVDSERFQRAVALRLAGNHQEALEELEALSSGELDSQYKSSLLLGQAVCLLGLHRVKEARQRWSGSVGYWRYLYTDFVDAILCEEEGKSDEAMRKLAQLLENSGAELREPGNEETYSDVSERLGNLLFGSKRYEEAAYHLNEALAFPETDERKRQLSRYLGICYLEIANFEVAENRLIESLPPDCADPSWTKGQYQLGCLYFKQREYAKAKKAFELCYFFTDDAPLKANAAEWITGIAEYLPIGNRENDNIN
jgi:tetratricopeptide (TPR) repeat protein